MPYKLNCFTNSKVVILKRDKKRNTSKWMRTERNFSREAISVSREVILHPETQQFRHPIH